MITYKKFFETLDKSNENQYTLINKHNISSSLINRLKHNKPISTYTINQLCSILKCRVEDIIEYIPDSDTDNN